MHNLKRQADENLRLLAENSYPGRGILLGRSEDGRLLQFYWIMGRSENSRNRVFVQEGKVVRTEPFDGSAMEDPSLVIYTAMNEVGGHHVATNGDHTDILCDMLRSGGNYRDALAQCRHEPDAPHFTPRIAGGFHINSSVISTWFEIIKANPFDVSVSDRAFYQPSHVAPGYGWYISTYRGDGSPLPAFEGEPCLLPLKGNRDDLSLWMWRRLNESNRISLALKVIDPGNGESEIKIINKNA